MEQQKLSFLIKAVYDVLPIPVNLHTWGLTKKIVIIELTEEERKFRLRICKNNVSEMDG